MLRPRVGAKEDKAALERSFIGSAKERGSESRSSERPPPQQEREEDEEGRVRRRSFEQCPRKARGPQRVPAETAMMASGAVRGRGNVSSGALSSEKLDCGAGVVIGRFDADFKYVQSCCYANEYCEGCAVLADDNKCGQCDSGYVLQANKRCIICDSLANWKDAEGRTCDDYETQGLCKYAQPPANDSSFEGLRPSDACCACGGGQFAATPWYYGLTEQVVIFGSGVSSRPLPETAIRYEVEPGCALGDLGLTLAEGGVVTALGGHLPPIEKGDVGQEMECEITAIEDASRGIQFSTTLAVSLQPMSYGPKVILFTFHGTEGPIGRKFFPLAVSPGLFLKDFKISCLPAVPWIVFSEVNGYLSYKDDASLTNTGGLSGDYSGFSGGECAVRAVDSVTLAEHRLVFAVLRAELWEAMQYEVKVVSARIGLPITAAQLVQSPPQGYGVRTDPQTGRKYYYSLEDPSQQLDVPKALPPELLDVICSGGDKPIRWSRQTGEVTINGQPAFIIDPLSGELSGTPQVDLGGELGRSTLTVTCHVAAGGGEYGTPLETAVKVDLVDDTCFFPRPNTELINAVAKTGLTPSTCRAQCRQRADCGGYVFDTDTCYILTSGSEGAYAYRPTSIGNSTINIRALCQPGGTCLTVQSSTVGFLEGLFCPQGSVKEVSDDAPQAVSTLYSRNGQVASAMFFLARGPCPLPGRDGKWVVRKPSPSDYLDPATGVTELNGEVVACVVGDIQTETFGAGSSTSVVYLPEAAFSLSQYKAFEAPNNNGQLSITVSLTSRDCKAPSAPASTEPVTLGNVASPGSYSLEACECFGEAYSKTPPVATESAKLVPPAAEPSGYNDFQPLPQLLLEGPYSCGKEFMLPFGTFGMVTEEACMNKCLEEAACLLFAYTADEQHCQLLSGCDSLGFSGLEFSQRVFGVFRDSGYCRIADPEACWTSRKRRALLDGSLPGGAAGGVDAASPAVAEVRSRLASAVNVSSAGPLSDMMPDACAFQNVLAQCDAMQMATTSFPGQCKFCEFFPVQSTAGLGRSKTPPPAVYTSGTQISVGCDNSDIGSRLLDQGLQVGSAVVDSAIYTCVDGTWRDKRGEEGLKVLSCAGCVQTAQGSYAERMKASLPEVYFMSMRELQYHFNARNEGCRTASDATSAPLRNRVAGRQAGLVFTGNYTRLNGPGVVLAVELRPEVDGFVQSWFLSPAGTLHAKAPYRGCLLAFAPPGGGDLQVGLGAECPLTDGKPPPGAHWLFDDSYRLVNLHFGKCLAPTKTTFDNYLPSDFDVDPLVLQDCNVFQGTQEWYFDGGNCRYQMELANEATPLTWFFKASGGSYFGAQEHHREMTDLSTAIEDAAAQSSVGSCRVSVNVRLKVGAPLDTLGGLERPLDLNDPDGKQVDQTYNLAYVVQSTADLTGNSTVFSCYPLDYGGVAGLTNLTNTAASLQQQIDGLRSIERDNPDQCRMIHCEAQIAGDSQELDAVKRQIDLALGDARTAVCAHDLPMSVELFSALAAGPLDDGGSGPPGPRPTLAEASSRCRLFHRGLPSDASGFELTWDQMASALRDQVYRATEAAAPTDAPFSSASAEPAIAQQVGFFAALDRGAALWGIRCKPGSVVAVSSKAGSPHCMYVEASLDGDVVLSTILPESATCDLGFAVGGWYNLPGSQVKRRSEAAGGPADSTGFLLYCRLVPGLSRLCNAKYGKCDDGEVVAGVLFAEDKSIQYKCCAVPKPVGFVFASEELLGAKPWEGYYCPAAVDDTGRPQYHPTHNLGRAAPDSTSTWFPIGQRQTPVGPDAESKRSVYCDFGEFMSSWHVQTRGAGRSLVAFACAKLGFQGALAKSQPAPTCEEHYNRAEGGSSVRFLEAVCPAGQALTGWGFEVLPGSDTLTTWTCCSVANNPDAGPDYTIDIPAFAFSAEFSWADLAKPGAFACPLFTVMQSFAASNDGKFVVTCLPVLLQALSGEGRVLRWNKFWGAWVQEQVSVSVHRNAIDPYVLGDKSIGVIQAECSTLPDSASALQGFRVLFLSHLFPYKPDYAYSSTATSEFRCRATVLGQCQEKPLPLPSLPLYFQELDNLSIDCGTDSVLTSFGFKPGGGDGTFTCCQAQVAQCEDHEVPLKSGGVLSEGFECGEGRVLQQIYSHADDKGTGTMKIRCCEAPGPLSVVAGHLSSTGQPQDTPALPEGPSGAGLVSVRAEGAKVEIALAGESFFASAGAPQLLGRVVRPSGVLSGTEIRDLPQDLNALEEGSVVALGGRTGWDSAAAPAVLWALVRCGAQNVSVEKLQAAGTYALVGTVGGAAVAEGYGDQGEALTLTAKMPRLFTVAPIVDFTGRSAAPRKELPVKPTLLKFEAKLPSYDKFCDLEARSYGLEDCTEGQDCPDITNPCFHVWQLKITEYQSWGCNQRDVDREYLEGTAEVQRLQYEAEQARLEFIYELTVLGLKAAAAAAAAWPPGEWGKTSADFVDTLEEGTERSAQLSAGALYKRLAYEGNKLTHAKVLEVLKFNKARVRKALAKQERFDLRKHAIKSIFKPVKEASERIAINSLARSGVTSEAFSGAFDSDKPLTLPDNTTVQAVPQLEAPDFFGFTTARNYDKLHKAGWLDCHPLQWGLSKLACDLFCTESAVKEGNAAIISNIGESQDILTRNIEQLLDYHSELIITSLNDVSSSFAQKPDAESFLFKPKHRHIGSAAESPQDLDLAKTRASLRELRALPQLLAMNVSMLRASGAQKLASKVVAWHAEASDRLLERLHTLLGRATAEDLPEAVSQAAGMVRQFNASRSLRLREPPAHAHDALQDTASKKAKALRAQVQGQRELLERASKGAGTLQDAPALDLDDDAVVIRWNQLTEFFVAAHEKHAVFAQARARALAATDEALRNAERYVGCGEEYGSIQDSWRRARRLDDEAASDLLRAWAATVAAQERLQMAVDAGLVERVAASAALHPGEAADEDAVRSAALLAEEAHTPCSNVTLLAEEAHTKGVQKVDGALFPLLQQVIVLERLARYQAGEIKSKKLQSVAGVPTTPSLVALARAARTAADPATPAGRALAARALERLVPRACRAHGRLGELSKKESVINEAVRFLR